MRKNISILILGVFILIAHEESIAADAYGVFMVVKGEVKVESGGKETVARVGSKVAAGDTVRSGVDARAKIVMSDRNVVSISPETTIRFAKYTASVEQKEVELDLSKGKVRTNVEQKYQGEKDRFLLKTPSAVAGVRGTRFMVGFEPKTSVTSLVTFHGAVSFSSFVGNVLSPPILVQQGQSTTATPGEVPRPPVDIPKKELRKLEGEAVKEAKNEEPPPDANKDVKPEARKKDEKNDEKKK